MSSTKSNQIRTLSDKIRLQQLLLTSFKSSTYESVVEYAEYIASLVNLDKDYFCSLIFDITKNTPIEHLSKITNILYLSSISHISSNVTEPSVDDIIKHLTIMELRETTEPEDATHNYHEQRKKSLHLAIEALTNLDSNNT
jgi:predicted HAD superfamily phosphohydrolase